MKYILETIAFNIDSCHIAQSAGASRIELCDNAGDGGTTPSFGLIKEAKKLLHIPLYVMIRPRGGDFLYNTDEFEIMKTDIRLCKEYGCDGVVFGLLDSSGNIDKRTAQLVDLAYPMGVTFHRAFDRCRNAAQALEEIIDTGCERILTSGQHPTAMEGAAVIASLIKQADERIIIMPGSGLRSDNIVELAQKTGATEFHTSAKTIAKSKMNFTNELMKDNSFSVSVNEIEVKQIIEQLSAIST
jgi:copper homeostasis protein